MKLDSVSAGVQSNMAIDASKVQQNEALSADKVTKQHHQTPKDVVTISTTAKRVAAEQKAGA